MPTQLASYPLSFNIDPYWDDYDRTKNHLKILFRPSRGVQARELTQMQSILQNQIEVLGNHIFKNNSPVTGGDITVHKSKYTITFTNIDAPLTDPTDVTQPNPALVGAAIFDVGGAAGSSFEARIDLVDPTNLQFIASPINGHIPTSSTISIYYTDGTGAPTTLAGTVTVNSSTHALTAHCTPGIIYTDGFFSYIAEQEVIIDKAIPIDPATNTTAGNYRVGFLSENIVINEADDPSLLDPAGGSYNYQAPGGDRFKKIVHLEAFNVDTQSYTFDVAVLDTEDFVPVVIIEQGQISVPQKASKYADIEELVARRTYEESGNYVSDPYEVYFEDHPTDPAMMRLWFGNGTSYMYGHRYDHTTKYQFDVRRARTTGTTQNKNVHINYGPTVTIKQYWDGSRIVDAIGATAGNTQTSFDINNKELLYFYDVELTAATAASAVAVTNNMGAEVSARISSFYRGPNGKMTINLIDASQYLISKFPSIRSFKGVDTGWWGNIEINTIDYTQNIQNTTKPAYIIKLSTEEVIANVTNSSIRLVETALVTANAAGGTVNTTAPTGSIINSGIACTDGTHGNIPGSFLASNGTDITFTYDPATPIDASVSIMMSVTRQNLTHKVKTLTTTTETLTVGGGFTSTILANVDVVDLVTVYPTGTTTGDVSLLFGVNSGQTDTTYDQGTLVGSSSAVAGTYDVTYRYFARSGGATSKYFSANSYANVDRALIAKFTSSTGEDYDLVETLDFRLDRYVNSTTGVITISPNSANVISGQSLICDYDYYFAREDAIYIDYNGTPQIKTGIEAVKVTEVAIPESLGMQLYSFDIPPYTARPQDIEITPIAQRRFTMTDIQGISERVDALEEVAALSILEQDADRMLIVDLKGLNKFKTGIFADPFKNHMLGQTTDPEYNCSIDPHPGDLRGGFMIDGANLVPDTGNTTASLFPAATATKAFAMLPIASTSLEIQQLKASNTTPVNPYAVFSFNGHVELSPSADAWTSVVYAPAQYATTGSWAGAGVNSTVWNNWITTSIVRQYIAPPRRARRRKMRRRRNWCNS